MDPWQALDNILVSVNIFIMSPEILREDALFFVEAALPVATAMALTASARFRAFAAKSVERIVDAGKVEDEMDAHPELTKGEAIGFVRAAKQIEAEDARRLSV